MSISSPDISFGSDLPGMGKFKFYCIEWYAVKVESLFCMISDMMYDTRRTSNFLSQHFTQKDLQLGEVDAHQSC